MLTLKKPIKTVLNPDLTHSSDAFCERIMGNYQQLGVELNQTDLLHVTNEPPEIFVMDGGMTNLFSAKNVENTQIQKTKILNNFINRIVLSADAGLSYQDNVYVTNILHKLGIKDEKTFLSEVHRMFSETREHHEAVRLYWENLSLLQTLIREYKSEHTDEIRTEEKAVKEPVLHLHEEINQRLQTAAIYRVLQNYYENDVSPRVLTNEMMMISEQSRLSREILLQRLREEVRMEPAYLTYRHENYYEGDELSREEITVETVSNRISSAVLLNLIDNIYDSVYRRIDHHLTNWISTEATYYGAAENTLFRIEQNTAYLQYLYEQTKNYSESEENHRNEVSVLQQLLNYYQSSDMRLQQSLGGNTYNTDVTNLSAYSDDGTATYYTDASSAELVHITNEGDAGDEVSNITENHSFSEAVDNIYRQNIVRNQQYMNALAKIMEKDKPSESPADTARRMMEESRLSFEHPEEFLREYQKADEKAVKETRERIIESEKLLSPQQQVAHELIREYLKAPERFYHSEVISEGNLGLMLLDIKNATVGEEAFGTSDGTPKKTGTEDADGRKETKKNINPYVAGEAESDTKFLTTERIFENDLLRDRAFTGITEYVTQNLGEQVILHRENSMVNTITERIIERWHEKRQRPSGFEVTYEEAGMAMVHRSKETVLDEEVIESMQQQIRQIEHTQQSVTESTRVNETENRTVINNIVNETIEHNTQAITDIVNSSVKKQLDEISDRVYGKIERQLKNEKRRRGL